MRGSISARPLRGRFRHPGATKDVSVPTILELVSQLTAPEVAHLRVLVLACGNGRVIESLRDAGHRVLATDLSHAVLDELDARLGRDVRGARDERIEFRQADMTAFTTSELFKAVCIPTSSLTLLDQSGQRQALQRATACLSPGGAVIVATEHIAHKEPTTTTVHLGPGVTFTEEVDPAECRRRTIVAWDTETRVTDLYLAPPSRLASELSRLGMNVVFQRFVADPSLIRHSTVILGAVAHS